MASSHEGCVHVQLPNIHPAEDASIPVSLPPEYFNVFARGEIGKRVLSMGAEGLLSLRSIYIGQPNFELFVPDKDCEGVTVSDPDDLPSVVVLSGSREANDE